MQKQMIKKKTSDSAQLLLKLQSLSDPSISEYVRELKAAYGKYALPARELRRIVDESMGAKTLTGILHQMREESA